MNHELFLKRLREVAEIEHPHDNRKQVPPPPKVTNEELDEMTEHEVKEYWDQLVAWRESLPNETIQHELVKIKHEPKTCEDCGKEVVNRKVHIRLCHTGAPHWRTHCMTCHLHQNPLTKKFDMNGTDSNNLWKSIMRPREQKYNSKYSKMITDFNVNNSVNKTQQDK